VCLSGSRDDLDSQFNQVGQTRIFRFTMEVFVYKWLILVIGYSGN